MLPWCALKHGNPGTIYFANFNFVGDEPYMIEDTKDVEGPIKVRFQSDFGFFHEIHLEMPRSEGFDFISASTLGYTKQVSIGRSPYYALAHIAVSLADTVKFPLPLDWKRLQKNMASSLFLALSLTQPPESGNFTAKNGKLNISRSLRGIDAAVELVLHNPI